MHPTDETVENMYSNARLKNRNKTQATQQAMSDYITAMSHDLKTPLVAIIGIGEILKSELKNTEHQELLSTLENATHTVLSLVKDILSLSRLESGHLQTLFEPFDLLMLIEGVVSTMSHHCLEKGIELLISYPPKLPRILISDSSAIRRIIINLLSSAIKFTDHGHILIKIIAENISEKEAQISLIVEDTGTGIPESCLNTKFENVSRLNLEDECKHQGAGLTIAIVKQLIHSIGGNLQINNIPSKGTQFISTIPMALKNENLSYLAHKTSPILFKILIVSDCESSYKIIKEILENDQVQLCRSSECSKILKDSYSKGEYFDIVLVDDKSLNPSSLSLAHMAKHENWINDTLFIYSGFPLNLTEMDQIKTAGFHEIISKPIQPSQLVQQIHSAWGKYSVEQKVTIKEPAKMTVQHVESNAKKSATDSYQILLVEDNLIAGYITQCILEGLNCSVELAKTGIEALELTKKTYYDMIFLDIDLPDIDGITLCRILRAQAGINQNSIIIALTSQIAEKEADICIAAGMNAFLEKPASTSNFTQIIQQFLIEKNRNAA